MAEITNDLMYEILKDIQTRIKRFEGDFREVKSELHAIRGHMNATQTDVANLYHSLQEVDGRVARIERRLELNEPLQ